MRKVMEPIVVGNRLVKFGFDSQGNEIAFYSDYYAEEDGTKKVEFEESTITDKNISDTLIKMIKCGKQLPQMSRIRSSREPAEEQQKVLAETIQMWCELFLKQKIGIQLWEKATDRALILNGIPRLDVQLISPALMQAALNECQKEYLLEQETSYGRNKQELNSNHGASVEFPEMGKIIAYHMSKHKKPLLPLPSPETIRAWASKNGWQDDTINKNMTKLRVYYCFGQHAKRDGTKMPIRIVLGSNKVASIEFVN